MGNRWTSLKNFLCCSHGGTTGGVHQGSSGLQNPPSGSPKSPPTTPPTFQNPIDDFKKTADTWDIDALIQAIGQLLKSKLNSASTSTSHTSSGSTDLIPNCASAISSGATFLKFVNEHTQKIDAKDNFFGSGEGHKVVEEILQQLGQLHWIVGGLSIIAYLLDKVDKVSENRSECLELLKCMFDLANHIKKLKGQVPEEKLKEAFVLIVEGCMTCASQLQSRKFFRFLKSSVNSQALNNLSSKINRLYLELNLTTVIETETHVAEIHTRIPEIQTGITEILTSVTKIETNGAEMKREQQVVLPVLHPAYPEGAVGLEEPLEKLKEKLDLQTTDVSSLVVVIYGFGGIGKTTLAKALVATLADDLKDHKYTKVEISEDRVKNDLKGMQQQILRDCFSTYECGKSISLRDCEEGRAHLIKAFKCEVQNPVFIFIDNALRSNDLKELFPEDLQGLPRRSRILVTTRNLTETDLFLDSGISRLDYAVNPLPEIHAFEILRIDPARLPGIRNDVDKIVRISGGIPLVLKIVGARLRKHNYKVENCLQIINALEHGVDVKVEDLSERLVHSVYKELERSTQEAFLDICSFFNGYQRRHVEYIVGVEEVLSLVEAAMVTSLPLVNYTDLMDNNGDWEISMVGEDKLIVHDVIEAKGREMAGLTRITGLESWSQAVKDQVHTMTKVKGVFELEESITIKESELHCMSNSLRIASFSYGRSRNIDARTSHTFQELRYLELNVDTACFPTKSEELPCLSVYTGPIFEEALNKLPQSLKYLDATLAVSDFDLESLKESKSFPALEELDLGYLKEPLFMLDGRLHFDALKILSLACWKGMEELSAQVCRLPRLKKLILPGCGSLKSLPESIANLSELTHLNLYGCIGLKELCSSFGDLRALSYLDLSECYKLKKLPDNFGQLLELKYLFMTGCKSLEELPGSFAQLKSLKLLQLGHCWSLEKLPSNFVQLQSLEVLSISFNICELLPEFNQVDCNWKIITDDDEDEGTDDGWITVEDESDSDSDSSRSERTAPQPSPQKGDERKIKRYKRWPPASSKTLL